MVNELVTSRLDYCNDLLYGTVDKNFARLQRLQYTAARLITRVPTSRLSVRELVCFKKGDSSTPQLHRIWGTDYIVQYKDCTMRTLLGVP